MQGVDLLNQANFHIENRQVFDLSGHIFRYAYALD